MTNIYLQQGQATPNNIQLGDPTQPPGFAPLQASPGAYTITGSSAALLVGHVLNAASGSYTITGASAQLLHNHPANMAAGSYTITGASASLIRTHLLNASPGSYTVTGANARLLEGRALTASPGAYTITGFAANLFTPRTLTFAAAPGAYVITGAAANLAKASGVKVDIDSVLTPKQLHELRRRLAREREQRGRNLEKEGQTRAELRSTLESFFRVAEPEQVEEIKERLPVKAKAIDLPEGKAKAVQFTREVDWPKLYDDRALMEGLTRDLSKILTEHIERQRFEREEDDLAILMLA